MGTHVWRRSDNRDAMHEDCIGPSTYNKGQGIAVRVWGMLAQGILYIHILDEDEVMDSVLYAELIEDKFPDWLGDCEELVCDFEGCLRTQFAIDTLAKIGVKLVEGYPRSSQDFNAIENAWNEVKKRLDETLPIELESRSEFVKRLTAAVSWVNWNKGEWLWTLCTNQKKRADDCLSMDPPGGRTKW